MDVDSGLTNLDITAYRYNGAGQRTELFATNSISFVNGGEMYFSLDGTHLGLLYLDSFVGQAEHAVDFPNTFTRGLFPVLIVENYGIARGDLCIDNVSICVPEPAVFLLAVILLGTIQRIRRK